MALIYLLRYSMSSSLVLICEMALAGCFEKISAAFGLGINPVLLYVPLSKYTNVNKKWRKYRYWLRHGSKRRVDVLLGLQTVLNLAVILGCVKIT